MEPVQAPWIRPAVVVHDPSVAVDALLGDFGLALAARGFTIAGFVQLNNPSGAGSLGSGCAERIELLDLGCGETLIVERQPGAATPFAAMASPAACRC